MTENASTRDPARCREYVDYAAEMGFPYYLADGGWPGYVDIAELVKYAEGKGVKIWLWEHSKDIRSPGNRGRKVQALGRPGAWSALRSISLKAIVPSA